MLFTSKEFLFAFLPLTLLVTWLAIRLGGRGLGIASLTAASIFFYGWWELRSVGIIAVSIVVNYLVASKISTASNEQSSKRWLFLGVVANLAALSYFKYVNFLIDNVANIIGWNVEHLQIVLPLAISFYTFQQIAFLVDTARKEMGQAPIRDYIISVLFFPHLIAGPLLHYRNIISQFENRFRITSDTIATGIPVFAVGLAKKVAVADPIAGYVSPLFTKAEVGHLEFFEAWAAALGYTAQLYFDFSGYSDMAIGIGLMFGIALPLNFFSPYKATSIIEFWRRWHITLSSFLRDYLYIPLGGSRNGPIRRQVNLLIVMLLGGLWHGASWTYVVWGGLHGGFLVINHAWRQWKPMLVKRFDVLLTPIYGAITFFLVVVAWVFFRSNSFATAINVLSGMFAPDIFALPGELSYIIGRDWPIKWNQGMKYIDFMGFWSYLCLAYLIIWMAPNSAQLFRMDGKVFPEFRPATSGRYSRTTLAACVAFLAWISAFGIFGSAPSEFLYFQF
ncbi:MBOAT family protein [Rhizobium daejeonense]|uniref:Probable alginate O-acetylase AlgI n=1 Tax=Rhizobium daejeonense TaxID=240521 RepID=A0A6M1S3W9_9HYPH|nr:MBOAT family protein [Rhizobium daejeonense]NGO63967.1 MBOAT family protein [Rhizobium daejeonense]